MTGSRRRSALTHPLSSLPRSVTLRSPVALRTASVSSLRARRMNRRRLERLLPRGLSRRSTIFIGLLASFHSPCLFDAHVPFDQPADLPLGVAAGGHAF